jgi:hypothetical protein
LELARKGGNGPFADKILERLEANEKWKANKVDLSALEQAVEGARTALQFGPKPADPDKIKDLFIEMGLEETYLDQLRVTVPLSHD